MKIRSGFVSNSSSTSYTIYYDPSASVTLRAKGKVCVEMTVNDFFDAIIDKGNYCSDETSIRVQGIENAIDYYSEKASWDDGVSLARFKEFLASRKKKGNVAVIRISYHDEFAKKMFNIFKATGLFELMDEDGIES